MSKRYPTHIPTTSLQKAILSVGSAITALANPARGDMVATMAETTAFRPILKNIRDRMACDVVGRALLCHRPRITEETINREKLRLLPDGTLGREYVRFLDQLHTSPDARPPVKYVDDDELVYVMQR